MRIQLAFGRTGLEIDLPDTHDYCVLKSPALAPLPDPVAAIEAALDSPVAGEPLAALSKGKRSAAISVCDITRPAPNPVVLPPLLRRLQAAGIPKDAIRILIATGLHRAATPAEIRQIVGEETAANFDVLNHDARNAAQHRRLGTTKSGTPVFVDERFIGAGYGRPTEAAQQAADMLSRTEAILVDPIYTAKALAGLVAGVRSGAWDGERIVFWHAGGLPGLFEPLDA